LQRYDPRRGKIISIVGNNAEKHTRTEIRAFFHVVAYNAEKKMGDVSNKWNIFPRCGQQRGEIIGVVGNNA
jgi:hypothetical protein